MMMSNTYMTGEEAIRLDGEDGTPNNNGKSVTNERIDMPLDCEMVSIQMLKSSSSSALPHIHST